MPPRTAIARGAETATDIVGMAADHRKRQRSAARDRELGLRRGLARLGRVQPFARLGHRVLRRLEAMLAVADREASLIITGNGDVLEPEHGLVAIGSGGAYAQSAAKALLDHTELSAEQIVKKSLEIAGELCIYTNMTHTIELL